MSNFSKLMTRNFFRLAEYSSTLSFVIPRAGITTLLLAGITDLSVGAYNRSNLRCGLNMQDLDGESRREASKKRPGEGTDQV